MQNYCQKFVGLHALTLIKWCMHVSQVKTWFEIELVAIFVLITDMWNIGYETKFSIDFLVLSNFWLVVFISCQIPKLKSQFISSRMSLLTQKKMMELYICEPKVQPKKVVGLIEYNSIESKQTSASYAFGFDVCWTFYSVQNARFRDGSPNIYLTAYTTCRLP